MADTKKMELRSKHQRPHYRSRSTVGKLTRSSPEISPAEMVRRVQKGFPYSAFLRFHAESGLPVGRLAELIQIPPRTLIRRKAAGRLQPTESERLLRLSTLFQKAVQLFEDDVNGARRWLSTPSAELDGQSPFDFARTEVGAREVEDLIGRLEHGVFA